MIQTQTISQLLSADAPSFGEAFESLRSNFPLLYELTDTPQDPIWHAEGNVRIHTEMVFNEINAIIANEASQEGVSEEEIIALRAAALLHDIAKPICSRYSESDGRQRIVAPHHADKGRSYCAPRIAAAFGNASIANTILALIGHHHDILPLSWNNYPQRGLCRIARHVPLRLLYYLELADTRGRICEDKGEGLEIVELFRLYAEEYGVWHDTDPYAVWKEHIHNALTDKPRIFQQKIIASAMRDCESGVISMPEEAVARSYHQRQPFSQMLVSCGVAGSGKSTYLQQHFPDYYYISLDDLRQRIAGKRADQSMNSQVLKAAQEELRVQLRAGTNVVWDATNLNRELRSSIVRLGLEYGAYVRLLAFVVPYTVLLARNAKRSYPVPPDILQRQVEKYDLPYYEEADEVVFIDAENNVR